MESLCQFERQVFIIRDEIHWIDIRNQIVLFNVNWENLSSSVDDNHSIRVGISCWNKAELISDLLPVQKSSSRYLVHVQKAHFGDDEKNTIFWTVLHQHWEIAILLNLNVSRSFDFLLAWSRVADLHNMKLLYRFTGLLLTEAEQAVLITIRIGHWHICESGCKAFQNLLLPFFCEEKLHVAANLVVGSLVDTNEVAPLVWRIDAVIHYLCIGELSLHVENLGGRGLIVDVAMIDWCLTNNG